MDFVIYRARFAAAATGLSTLILLGSMFYFAGTFDPEVLPELYTSREQVLGTVMLLVLMPPILLAGLFWVQRRSERYGRALVENRTLENEPEGWLRPIHWSIPALGTAFGLVYALTLNTPHFWLAGFIDKPVTTQSIVLGQAILWMAVGLVLGFRLHTAFSFNKLGRRVRLDLLNLHLYEPFAKNGVDDVLAIVLLMALSGLQSLDAQFRIGNYVSALLIGVPAAGLLFLGPMYSVHRRLVDLRASRVAELDAEVEARGAAVGPESIDGLELLLQHRDRVRNAATWPIDWSIYSRLAIYVVIPPIAWLGAAFVEFWLDRVLEGS